MAKSSAQFQCRECAVLLPKWSGQCPDCKGWNSIEEIPAVTAGGARANWHGAAGRPQVMTLDQLPTSETPRFGSCIGELDRVLGGGLVEGSVVLLGGDPGIGKSTILLQCMTLISQQRDALYVTGEESPPTRSACVPDGSSFQVITCNCSALPVSRKFWQKRLPVNPRLWLSIRSRPYSATASSRRPVRSPRSGKVPPCW